MSEALPTNHGRVDGKQVVVDDCVVCGATHYHGVGGFAGGEGTRAPHCDLPRAEQPIEYRIVLEGGEPE